MNFKLKDEFVKKYESLKPPFGFNGLGELVYLRTYSRTKENGENEKWHETVRRVVEGTYSVQKRHIIFYGLGWNEDKAYTSAEEMYDRMYHMKFLPPGRGLWAMGTDIIEERELFVALNNCFTGDTTFLTDGGSVKFEDMVGETVNVLTNDTTFKEAYVSSFGTQPINEITFKPFGFNSNYSSKIKATPNHRWIYYNGEETTNLKIGDVVKSNYFNGMQYDDFNDGYIHGLVFADGTRHTYYHNRFILRLCGDKNSKLEQLCYSKLFRTKQVLNNGDNIITLISDNINLKQVPSNKTASYINGFINGWIDFDGWKKPSGSICLDTSNIESANWILEHASLGGYSITGYREDNSPTNYGERSYPLQRITMKKGSVNYVVTEIKSLAEEEVFCVTEPETGTFTLSNGILTGNCAFVSTKDILIDGTKPFEFMMDFSMLGVGTGFDIKGASLMPVRSPNFNDLFYTIPDTREGWVESLKLLLNAYFKGDSIPTFNYSLIRSKGAPIKTFGGKSAGSEPLIKLHNQIKRLLTERIGSYMTGTDIVDIMNMIGQCVVAGNVRRTAQISFGEPTDEAYLKLKDYKWDEEAQIYRGTNTHRAEYGWASNNSIYAKIGMDYTKLAEQTAKNGEPGYIWLDNIQEYSRMNGNIDLKDSKAQGTNPCGEQTLESYEMCTLVETFPTKHETTEDYLRTLKFAYLYAKTVTLGKTHWPETNRVQLRNRRIGTSISGIAQYIDKNGIAKFKDLMEKGYNTLSYYDAVYSDWLAVPRSIKMTSIKPSGTVSLLPGVTPGMHYPESNYYIRRMRISGNSDLVPYIENAHYPVEKDLNDPDHTVIVEVPVSIEGVRTINDISMWEQLELASFIQQYWSDNQVSCTITFKADEKKDIAKALNYFQYRLKAVSFLPKLEKASYPQMPYEEITKEEYERRVNEIQPLQFNGIGVDSKPEMYCNNDTCEII